MTTFVMLGKYSSESVQGISAARTKNATDLIRGFGGEVRSIYALLGEKDLVVIVDLPGIEAAVKASVALSKATGIAFTTCPAIEVKTFDAIMADA